MTTLRLRRPGETGQRTRGSKLPAFAIWTVLTVAGFAVCYLLARTRAVNSDGAGNALQAWDMLHGNPLLRGWRLSDVSFYTTELPEYMLVEIVRGLNASVVHIAAAATYTLAVLTAALVAKGPGGRPEPAGGENPGGRPGLAERESTPGRAGVLRAVTAAGIMLAPQLGNGTNTLLSSPDHIGTSVPVLVAWLILDRGGRRRWVAVAVPLLLGVTAVGDTLALYVGVAPVVLVCAYRALRGGPRWFEIALGAGSLACGLASYGVLKLIHAAGGFYIFFPHSHLAPLSHILSHNLRVTVDGLLLLGGASFTGTNPVFAAIHLIGIAVAAWAFLVTVWRWNRGDLVDQILVVGIVANVAGYLFTTAAISIGTTREMNPVLPLAAALAGRRIALLAERRILVPAMTLVLAGYAAGLVHEAVQPAAPPQHAYLASWLSRHHLTSGLSGYWASNAVTLSTGDHVRLLVGSSHQGKFAAGSLETNVDWYDPAHHYANFVVMYPSSGGYGGFDETPQALASFGRPARVYHTKGYTIMVWNKNLLADLAFVPPA